MNRLEKNREPEVVFVSEKKQKEYPHRPRKEIDMDQYLILYRQGLPNRQIASRRGTKALKEKEGKCRWIT